MHRSLLAGTLCQELPVTVGQRNIPRELSPQLWIILESSRDSRSLTTNPGPSEPLKVSPRLQCRSTRVSTLVELEGTAVLVCYEWKTAADTSLPPLLKTGRRSETQGFLAKQTQTHKCTHTQHTHLPYTRHAAETAVPEILNGDMALPNKHRPGRTEEQSETLSLGRCRRPRGTETHEHVWWYGRGWRQRWGGWARRSAQSPCRWLCQRPCSAPEKPCCSWHSLSWHLTWLAPGPKEDYEPPLVAIIISNQDEDLVNDMMDLKVCEGDSEDQWVGELNGEGWGGIILILCVCCEHSERSSRSCWCLPGRQAEAPRSLHLFPLPGPEMCRSWAIPSLAASWYFPFGTTPTCARQWSLRNATLTSLALLSSQCSVSGWGRECMLLLHDPTLSPLYSSRIQVSSRELLSVKKSWLKSANHHLFIVLCMITCHKWSLPFLQCLSSILGWRWY